MFPILIYTFPLLLFTWFMVCCCIPEDFDSSPADDNCLICQFSGVDTPGRIWVEIKQCKVSEVEPPDCTINECASFKGSYVFKQTHQTNGNIPNCRWEITLDDEICGIDRVWFEKVPSTGTGYGVVFIPASPAHASAGFGVREIRNPPDSTVCHKGPYGSYYSGLYSDINDVSFGTYLKLGGDPEYHTVTTWNSGNKCRLWKENRVQLQYLEDANDIYVKVTLGFFA